MFCNNCGKEIDDKDIYCQFCGECVVNLEGKSVSDIPQTEKKQGKRKKKIVISAIAATVVMVVLILFIGLGIYNKFSNRTDSFLEEEKENQVEREEISENSKNFTEEIADKQPDDIEENILEDFTEKEAKGSEYTVYHRCEAPISFLMTEAFKDCDDHYTITGSLTGEYAISYSEFDKVETGESFVIQGKHFTKGESFQTDEYPETIYPIYCIEDDCTYYTCDNIVNNFGSRFGRDYYTLCYSVPDYEWPIESMEPVINDFGVCELKVKKDAYITSQLETYMEFAAIEETGLSEEEIFNQYEEQRKKILESSAHMAKDCFENHILIDDWIDIANFLNADGEKINMSVPCFIYFDEKGMVDSMILYSY